MSIRRTVPVTNDSRAVVSIGTFSAARAEKLDPIGFSSRVRTDNPVAVVAQGVVVHDEAPFRSSPIIIVVCTPTCGGQPATSAVSISSTGKVSTSSSSKSRTASPWTANHRNAGQSVNPWQPYPGQPTDQRAPPGCPSSSDRHSREPANVILLCWGPCRKCRSAPAHGSRPGQDHA